MKQVLSFEQLLAVQEIKKLVGLDLPGLPEATIKTIESTISKNLIQAENQGALVELNSLYQEIYRSSEDSINKAALLQLINRRILALSPFL